MNPNNPRLPSHVIHRIDGFVHGYRAALGLPEPVYGSENLVPERKPKYDVSSMKPAEKRLFELFNAAMNEE